MAEAPGSLGEGCVSLEDVCLRFTAEEWGLLDDTQKLLYHNVMLENFLLVLSLGLPISKPFPGIQVYPSWSYLLQNDKHVTTEPSISI
ncbi:zinc finger protein 671-like [Mus pahari]|uniref:zinc finger protein 671-like n=1 Tax=Mus pahari TaxID=10093 RepID=UPI000A308AD7|nr:zinc finger protein 671-like [Mus pahari]